MTDEQYDKLPTITWNEILGSNRWPIKRRPRRMNNTLSLDWALWWIDKLIGIPPSAIQFVKPDSTLVSWEEVESLSVADLQDKGVIDTQSSGAYSKNGK